MNTPPEQRPGVYGWSPGRGGVHFHRIAEPLRVLAELGHRTSTGPQLDDEILDTVDTVLAHTLHGEAETKAWHELARIGTHRLVLDVDDWLWAPDIPSLRDAYPPDVLDRLFSNVERAHVVTTPSGVIASYLSRFNRNVWVVPNTVPAYVLDIPRPDVTENGLWLGWQGALNRSADWKTAAAGVAKFLSRHEDWGIGIIGEAAIDDNGTDRHWVKPWTSDRKAYYASVAAFTIGLGPLRDTLFNRAKSSLRAVEYAALGVVPVLPDLDPYRHVIKSGRNGYLVRDFQTHRRVLTEIAANLEWLDAMGKQARDDAANWTTEAAIGAWAEAWNSIGA